MKTPNKQRGKKKKTNHADFNTEKYSNSSDSKLIQSGFPRDGLTRGKFAGTFKLIRIAKFLQWLWYTQKLCISSKN